MAKHKSPSTETDTVNVVITGDAPGDGKHYGREPSIGDRVLYVLPAASPHANEQREAVIVGILVTGEPALCVTAMPGDFLYGRGGWFEIVDDGAGYDAGGKPGTWRYGMGESAQQ